MRLTLALKWLLFPTVLAACGPTVLSTSRLATSADYAAWIEVRDVQPDALDDSYNRLELWGINRSSRAVCVGNRAGSSPWRTWMLQPNAEVRLSVIGQYMPEGENALLDTSDPSFCNGSYIERNRQ